ncbi:hypothetical protein AAVH_21705 [Aphelenchoides avenae]|nr:hypothetical protein AAVH_21705 [Aphelenchus avenae]
MVATKLVVAFAVLSVVSALPFFKFDYEQWNPITSGTNGGPDYADFVAELLPQKIKSLSPKAKAYVDQIVNDFKSDFKAFSALSPAAKKELQAKFPAAAFFLKTELMTKVAHSTLGV